MATIYMPFLNEGTEVWRPVDATPLKGDTYKVEGQMDEDEVWAFVPGAFVRCEWKVFNGGEAGLVAVALAD